MRSNTSCNWTVPCHHNPEQKARFHRAARERLKTLADAMDWSADSYDLRCNQAGIAVSAEITLHHDSVYIQASQPLAGVAHGILLRTCQGRHDYTGGPNHTAPLALLDDIPALCRRVRAVTGA